MHKGSSHSVVSINGKIDLPKEISEGGGIEKSVEYLMVGGGKKVVTLINDDMVSAPDHLQWDLGQLNLATKRSYPIKRLEEAEYKLGGRKVVTCDGGN